MKECRRGSVIVDHHWTGNARIRLSHGSGLIRDDGAVVIERADVSDLISALKAWLQTSGELSED